ncbi:Mini-ribonuclease 3 [Ethanoligenens sp.]|uniref:Mini-ribonuclease 3 n=1 Tax=Ethanoligenens sp. TaxID=2099655 RepID=UPI0039E9EF4D
MLDNLLNVPLPPAQAALFSPLTLAFIGDAVYELLVREQVVAHGSAPVGKLHHRAVDFVRADAQAHAVQLLLPMLTETETTVLRRGRNANTAHVAKHADPADYRYATGLEALFGYLYLIGENGRLRELFTMIVKEKETAAGKI